MRDFHGKWRDKNEVSFGGGREGKMVFVAVFLHVMTTEFLS